VRYNEEFKRNALDMYLRSGKTQEVVATELGVNVATLQYWCRQFVSGEGRVGKVAARGLEAELQAYKKEVERLRRDNDILKKAAACVSRELCA
jgi:transposase